MFSLCGAITKPSLNFNSSDWRWGLHGWLHTTENYVIWLLIHELLWGWLSVQAPDDVHYWVNWWGPPWLATQQWGSSDYRLVALSVRVNRTDYTTGLPQKQERNISSTIKLWFCLSIPLNNICHILLDCKIDLRSFMAVIGTRAHIVTTSCMPPIYTLWSCECWLML